MRALLVLLIACDAARPTPPPAPVAVAPVVVPADAAINAPVAVTALPAMPATRTRGTGDAAWKRDVVTLATAMNRYVAGWGTIALDGEHPIRFATLSPVDYADSRGAYVLELARHHVIEVTYYVDGRTSAFDGGDGVQRPADEVPWLESEAKQIDHESGHHHGGESIQLALRDGELVLLSYNYTDDTTEPSDQSIAKTFPSDFACRPRCPLAATYRSYWGSQLAVSQPARSAAELLEPTPAKLPDSYP